MLRVEGAPFVDLSNSSRLSALTTHCTSVSFPLPFAESSSVTAVVAFSIEIDPRSPLVLHQPVRDSLASNDWRMLSTADCVDDTPVVVAVRSEHRVVEVQWCQQRCSHQHLGSSCTQRSRITSRRAATDTTVRAGAA
jgi:hypothetical protein